MSRLLPALLMPALLSLALGLSACRQVARAPAPVRTIDYWALVGVIESGDAEARYQAVLELRRFDGPQVRERLEGLLRSDEVLTQNAAARVLGEMGLAVGTAVLVDNLDPDLRTYMVTDAIHHLHELHGPEQAYDPNLGYRAQGAQQIFWKLGVRGAGERTDPVLSGAQRAAYEQAFGALQPLVSAYLEPAPEDRDESWKRTVALWSELAALQKSRQPDHVALVTKAFDEMTTRWPGSADLANNHALAALNNSEWEAAEASYRRALALSPDTAYFHNDYGILLEGLGRLEEAETQYRQAIRLDDEDTTWFANLADVLRKQQRTEAAVAAYREAEQRAPEKWYYHRLWIRRLRGR